MLRQRPPARELQHDGALAGGQLPAHHLDLDTGAAHQRGRVGVLEPDGRDLLPRAEECLDLSEAPNSAAPVGISGWRQYKPWAAQEATTCESVAANQAADLRCPARVQGEYSLRNIAVFWIGGEGPILGAGAVDARDTRASLCISGVLSQRWR